MSNNWRSTTLDYLIKATKSAMGRSAPNDVQDRQQVILIVHEAISIIVKQDRKILKKLLDKHPDNPENKSIYGKLFK